MAGTESGRDIKARFGKARRIALAFALVLSALVIYAAVNYWTEQAAAQIRQKAAETLAVQTEILSGVLQKYRLLPPLLGRQDDIAALFTSDWPWPQKQALAKLKAEEVAGMSGAREVTFLMPDGALFASARDIYRPEPAGSAELTSAARHGILGRIAVSLDNADRAYAFGAGVRRGGELLGVIAVYAGFEGIEEAWSLSTNPVFVSNESGIVILTNRPEWRLKPAALILNDRSNQRRYVDLLRDLPLLGWQLHVLAEQAPARNAGLIAATVTTLLCIVAGATVLLVLNRREGVQLQMRKDRAQSLRLERLVRDRTKALSLINQSLSHEVDERIQAEQKLRKAQTELIQTAKLAVLGQMAATLSHEMNQPLAAMRTYADNAGRLLALDRPADVASTLDRITAMVDRMAELSGALLSFSRKPGVEKRQVSLAAVLNEALILVRPRAAREGVKLSESAGLEDFKVLGGRIRLSQVFVNLINNAIDALRGQADAQIVISARREGDDVVTLIADNGPGIPAEIHDAIFDPFFTTKPPGEGIGVGLSIVYNIVQDFGGSIRLIDRGENGCTFELRLRAADGD